MNGHIDCAARNTPVGPVVPIGGAGRALVEQKATGGVAPLGNFGVCAAAAWRLWQVRAGTVAGDPSSSTSHFRQSHQKLRLLLHCQHIIELGVPVFYFKHGMLYVSLSATFR